MNLSNVLMNKSSHVKVKGRDTMIMCLYVDDLILVENNKQIFENFKKKMAHEFEINDLGLISYFL